MPFTFLPMLAMPADAVPTGDWSAEVKWDGIRAGAIIDAGSLTIVSRNGNDITTAYPELAAMSTAVGTDAVLDGEIVATDERGHPSFERLQRRMHVRDRAEIARLVDEVPVAFLAFDLLRVGSETSYELPWHARRTQLDELLEPGDHWRISPAVKGDALAALFDETLSIGLEGIVAKRVDSRYEPGKRSASWRKVKHFTSQEFVVGGYEIGRGARADTFGSLVLGIYENDELVCCGEVGSGFSAESLRLIRAALDRIARPASPFARGPVPRETSFVEPVIVVDVRFTNWTDAGIVRAPSFRGVRADIEPTQVQRISR